MSTSEVSMQPGLPQEVIDRMRNPQVGDRYINEGTTITVMEIDALRLTLQSVTRVKGQPRNQRKKLTPVIGEPLSMKLDGFYRLLDKTLERSLGTFIPAEEN